MEAEFQDQDSLITGKRNIFFLQYDGNNNNNKKNVPEESEESICCFV